MAPMAAVLLVRSTPSDMETTSFNSAGAGWGGCTVSLVKEKDVPVFLSKLRENYEPFKNLDDAAFSAACFATKPAEGACGKCEF